VIEFLLENPDARYEDLLNEIEVRITREFTVPEVTVLDFVQFF
jgi:hypothetical protein